MPAPSSRSFSSRRQILADHDGADRGVRQRVDQNQTTSGAIARVGIEKERLAGFKLHRGDFVHFEMACGMLFEGVDVHAKADARGLGFHVAPGVLRHIEAVQFERHRVQPYDHRQKALGRRGLRIGRNQHVAPAQIDFVFGIAITTRNAAMLGFESPMKA